MQYDTMSKKIFFLPWFVEQVTIKIYIYVMRLSLSKAHKNFLCFSFSGIWCVLIQCDTSVECNDIRFFTLLYRAAETDAYQ